MNVLTILTRQRNLTFCSSLGSFYMTNSISSPTLVKLSSWSTFYLSHNLYYNRACCFFSYSGWKIAPKRELYMWFFFLFWHISKTIWVKYTYTCTNCPTHNMSHHQTFPPTQHPRYQTWHWLKLSLNVPPT